MNAHVKTPEAAEDQVPALIEVTEQTAADVLKDEKKFEAFYGQVEAATKTLVADISSKEGREAIASMAYKVSKTKTAIDKIRLRITEDWRKQTEEVNKAGKRISARLDALRDEVRKPLTEWEATEKARQDAVDGIMATFRDVAPKFSDTAEAVATRLAAVKATVISQETFRDQYPEAMHLQGQAIQALTEAHAALVRQEADQRELAELRASRGQAETTVQAPLAVPTGSDAPEPVQDRGVATAETLADLQQRAGLTLQQAKAVVMAITAGTIRHVRIEI
jgi:hypothetical protein